MADLAWSFAETPSEQAEAGVLHELRRWRRVLVILVLADAASVLLLWLIGWHFSLKSLWADVQSFKLSTSLVDIAMVSWVKCSCIGGLLQNWRWAAGVSTACLCYLAFKALVHAGMRTPVTVHHLVWITLAVCTAYTIAEIWVLWRFSKESARRRRPVLLGSAAPLAGVGVEVHSAAEQPADSGFCQKMQRYHREHNRLIEFAREKERAKNEAKQKRAREAVDRAKDIPDLDGRRLWREFRQNASLSTIVPATILSFSLCLISVVRPTVNGKLMDAVVGKIASQNREVADLAPYFWAIAGLTLYQYFANVAVGILFALARWRMSMAMRKKLFWAIIAQDVTFFDSNPSGTLTSRLVHDADQMQAVLNTTGDTIGKTLVQFSSGSVAIFLTDWRLALVGIISFPISVRLTRITGRIVGYYSLIQNDAMAVANSRATEAIGNVRTVQANAAEETEYKAYSSAIDTYVDVIMHTLFSETFLRFVKSFLDNATSMAILIYGMYLVVQGDLTIGQYSAFNAYLATYNTGFNQMMNLWVNMKTVKTSSQRYFELVDRVPLVTCPSCPHSLRPAPGYEGHGGEAAEVPVRGVVRFEDVLFSYPKIVEVGFSSLRYGTLPWLAPTTNSRGAGVDLEADSSTEQLQAVLQNISFEAHPGQMVALVGRSGAGKSTTVKLLQRFYDPAHGSVSLDGQDLRTLDLKFLRSQFGYVEQEPALFNRSVRENIAYGLDEAGSADEGRLHEAATLANAHAFIMDLPDKYDTLCGERGVRLSGGQKQRLAIARAVIRRPRVIILDEATAALDAESEYLVKQALEEVRKDRSLVVIAHRLSTIRGADAILVFENGSIVERGTHEMLLSLDGRYAALVKQQMM